MNEENIFESNGQTPETVSGYVSHIVFRNEENGYTVLELTTGENEELTATGNFPEISEGETVRLFGRYVDHVNYGRQFQMESYELTEPETEGEILRYLSSGAIKGIGPSLAKRIVKSFGTRTFRVMEDSPEELASVKGISLNRAMAISDQMAEKRDVRSAMLYLSKYGIRGKLALRLYETYGTELRRVLETNPYQMAEDVRGVGFAIADGIARRMGIAADSGFRIRCGVLYVLNRAALNGHTFLHKEELRRGLTELLGTEPDPLDEILDSLLADRQIRVIHQDEIYDARLYRTEESAAEMLLSLDWKSSGENDPTPRILKAVHEEGITLDEKQLQAVREAATRGVLILTGGPGTGKTTTIRAMIDYFLKEGSSVLLGAPTGRAAKRMTEATGYEARTIHRLLEVQGGPENGQNEQKNEDARETARFERNSDNPLEADVIIIDEMSMVDIFLFHALLDAIPPMTRLILVGDVNQLPSVGPGNVLRDLIDSGCFSVVRLERIFRQAAESDIVLNAHRINQGEEVSLDNKSRDFFFLKRYDAKTILGLMLHFIKGKLPAYVGADPLELQVLTPTRKGLTGVDNINRVFQRYLNPPSPSKKEAVFGDRLFREGDKVMQIRNDYQMEWRVPGKYGITQDSGTGVFNGDMGIVTEIDTETSTMTVRYDEGRLADYDLHDLADLELAYAVTVHKSQGSEYPAVLIPLLRGPRQLMNRNILYTAVTRAKKCVVIIGDETVFREMIANTTESRRNTGLKDRLIENLRPD